MSRIRSIHPGLFTDEDFVSLSDAAQIFFIGLWTEADDCGAFEWKPITLKMKLRPASTSPVEPLLEELISAGRVKKYEHDGRHYGVIRNFLRYQRPKFPKSIHFIPPDLRRFAGSSEPITEKHPDDDTPFPRNAEIAPQMEDGGWRMEDVGGRKEESEAGDVVPLPRAREPRAAEFAFAGSIIHLTQQDFDNWRRSYSGIPDLRAELETIDARLVDQGHSGKWFGMVSAWLRAKHEKAIVAGDRAFGNGFGAPGFA